MPAPGVAQFGRSRVGVTTVKMDEDSSTVEFHLVKLAAFPEAKRRDGEPKEAA